MTTLVLETDPVAVDVTTAEEAMTVRLADGRSITIPLAWYPRLMHGSVAQRQQWQLLGNGYAIEWPDLDEHISVEGLLAGRRSGESKQSLARWLAARPSRAESKRSKPQGKRRDAPRGKRRGKSESSS
jgi:hypothetical protein